jgi:hypothetical protein
MPDNVTDLKAQLEKWEPGDHTDMWEPEPGETVYGRIQAFNEFDTVKGPARTVVLELEGGGELGVWLTPVVLAGEFARLQPLVGEFIGIKYGGQPPGKAWHAYKLLVVRDGGAQPTKAPATPANQNQQDDDDAYIFGPEEFGEEDPLVQ